MGRPNHRQLGGAVAHPPLALLLLRVVALSVLLLDLASGLSLVPVVLFSYERCVAVSPVVLVATVLPPLHEARAGEVV